MNELKASELLGVAREKIASGWCKNKLRDGDTYCALGALAAAMSEIRPASVVALSREGLRALESHLSDFGWRNSDLPAFNDAETTTHQDVINLYDKAINGLVEQGR